MPSLLLLLFLCLLLQLYLSLHLFSPPLYYILLFPPPPFGVPHSSTSALMEVICVALYALSPNRLVEGKTPRLNRSSRSIRQSASSLIMLLHVWTPSRTLADAHSSESEVHERNVPCNFHLSSGHFLGYKRNGMVSQFLSENLSLLDTSQYDPKLEEDAAKRIKRLQHSLRGLWDNLDSSSEAHR